MNELYETKELQIDDNYIQNTIVSKLEELLSENEELKKEIFNLQNKLRSKKRPRKNISIDETSESKPIQLSFELFNRQEQN